MIDHHVDRPDVYKQQCSQLTGPNRPIGSRPNQTARPPVERATHHAQQSSTSGATAQRMGHHKPSTAHTNTNAPGPEPHTTHTPGWLGRPGGHCGEPAPDPISNSAVKIPSAHDTAPQGAGKSVAARSSKLPTHNTTPPHTQHTTTTHYNRGVEQPGSSSGS